VSSTEACSHRWLSISPAFADDRSGTAIHPACGNSDFARSYSFLPDMETRNPCVRSSGIRFVLSVACGREEPNGHGPTETTFEPICSRVEERSRAMPGPAHPYDAHRVRALAHRRSAPVVSVSEADG